MADPVWNQRRAQLKACGLLVFVVVVFKMMRDQKKEMKTFKERREELETCKGKEQEKGGDREAVNEGGIQSGKTRSQRILESFVFSVSPVQDNSIDCSSYSTTC